MAEQDYWDSPTESGLPDNFSIVIGAETFFAPNAKRGSGEVTMLNVVGVGHGEGGEEFQFTVNEPLLVNTGTKAGWKSLDGGATVVHPDGKIKFNENSELGAWVKRIAVDLGGREVLRATGKTPLQAAFWHGMSLHLVRETLTAKDRTTGTEFSYDRLIPDRFDGYQGAQPPSTPPTSGVAAPDAVAAAKAKVEAAKAKAANGSGSLEEKVRAIAAAHSDYASYEAEVLTLDGITDDDALLAKALDQQAGIFAEAHA